MSFVHGTNTRVYIGGFDLSRMLNSFSLSRERETGETTTFTATARAYVPGLGDATLSAEGLFSGSVGESDVVLSAAMTGDATLWNWLPYGDVDGAFGYGLLAIQSSYEIEAPVDDMVSVTAEGQSNVSAERVQTLAPLAARTITGNGIARDNAVATAAGGVAYLHVTAATGVSPSLTGRIQHSADAVTWTDLIILAAETVAHRAQRVTVAGTVNRHVRAQWTMAGTGPSFTFFIAFGRY